MSTATREEYLTLQEACRYAKTSEATLRRRKAAKQINFYKPCGRNLLKRSELDKMIDASVESSGD